MNSYSDSPENAETLQAAVPSSALSDLYQRTLAALREQDEASALILCRQALRQVGGHRSLLNNLALVLKRLNCFGESEQALRDLLAAHPQDSDAWSNLAEVCKAQCKLDDAVAALRRAMACPASHRSVHDNLLLMLQYMPQLYRDEIAREHRLYGQRFALHSAPVHRNSADPERPLRIGYLSPDFRRHAAARFIEPLLQGRDRAQFQVLLYGQLQDLDAVSRRLIELADGWCCSVGLGSEQLAQKIRTDRIDLLVDLAGHTAGNRLDVMQLRPAPLQLTTLGYPDSTGLVGLDGRISDAVLDPEGEERFSTEPLLRLECSFSCFQPPVESPGLSDLPCLTKGASLRLLSPHQLFKLNEPLLRLWASVLQRLPDAELVLMRSSLTAANQSAMNQRLMGCGIDPARVRMERPPRDEIGYLQAIASCDLMLDAWPHNGHTTACEALWMGLPVITLRGDRPCGRLAASVLSAMGRGEWIAADHADYVDIAVCVAQNRDALQAVRLGLRDQMAATVANAAVHMAQLEALYRRLWRQWCQQRPLKRPLITPIAEPLFKAAREPSVNSTEAISCESSAGLAALLERLDLSVLLTTYRDGRVVSIGSQQGQLRIGFASFDQAIGLSRTPTGIAVGSRDAILNLPANREIAAAIKPEGGHDIAFLARSCHHTGPLMGHDIAWGAGRLWLVNTLFNGLVTIEADWSFVPRWQPPFISGWSMGDRCHLNGLAMAADESGPAYVTALGESDTQSGWRQHRATGGCLLHVPSGEVVLRELSLPHSPRLYNERLYLLESGRGALVRLDSESAERSTIAEMPGFTRGLDCFAGRAFVGLSQIRDTEVFAGLPLQQSGQAQRCGLAIVDLSSGVIEELLWFTSGIEEVFAVTVLPGWRNPAVVGPDTSSGAGQSVWLVPPPVR